MSLPVEALSAVPLRERVFADSFYRALQTKVQKRFAGGGMAMVAYTWSHFRGSADVLSPWLEANRFGWAARDGTE